MSETLTSSPHPQPAVRRRWNARLLVAGSVVALAFAYLIAVGMETSIVYYVTPSELVGGAAAHERPVRVAGMVVDGSIERDDQALMLRFVFTDGTERIPVVYEGVVPDMFGYASEGYYQDVVIEGRYTSAGVLEASQLIVSHGAEMEAAAPPAASAPGFPASAP